MLDFTSSLYLDMRHAHSALRPWTRLTTGLPAAYEVAPEAEGVAQNLAKLLNCERATLATSTLHLFLDLFDVLASERIVIYVEETAYPTVRWGIERVTSKGVGTATFHAHDPAALQTLLDRDLSTRCRPVVVTDGMFLRTGGTAPLPDYLRVVRERNGFLVIDDTQALGLLGKDPSPNFPYGRGGAGTPAWHGVGGPELIIGSSLAKGFGAPLAVLAGNAEVIAKFEALSSTRVHCSPPSIAVINAAERALAINARVGDHRRNNLAKLVGCFRDRLGQVGLSASGGTFPVQTIMTHVGIETQRLHERLLRLGVKTILHSESNAATAILSFVLNTRHTPSDINAAVAALQRAYSESKINSDRTTKTFITIPQTYFREQSDEQAFEF